MPRPRRKPLIQGKVWISIAGQWSPAEVLSHISKQEINIRIRYKNEWHSQIVGPDRLIQRYI